MWPLRNSPATTPGRAEGIAIVDRTAVTHAQPGAPLDSSPIAA